MCALYSLLEKVSFPLTSGLATVGEFIVCQKSHRCCLNVSDQSCPNFYETASFHVPSAYCIAFERCWINQACFGFWVFFTRLWKVMLVFGHTKVGKESGKYDSKYYSAKLFYERKCSQITSSRTGFHFFYLAPQMSEHSRNSKQVFCWISIYDRYFIRSWIRLTCPREVTNLLDRNVYS